MKSSLNLFIFLFVFFTQFILIVQSISSTNQPPPPPPSTEEAPPSSPTKRPPKGNSPTSPGVNGMRNAMKSIGKMGSSVFSPTTKILSSGDWGIKNLRLDSSFTFSSFNDASDSVASSGHFKDYSLSLTGDITAKDTLSVQINSTKLETGGSQGILSRSIGATISWRHSFNENYGAGAMFLWNEIDTEEINGNSHALASGVFFTTFHEFEYFSLSSVSTIAYADFDTDHDVLFMSAVTASKQITDNFGAYLTFSFTDSLRNDPDADPTYGTWEIGGVYSFTDKLAVSLGYQKTVFLNNYSDNTLLINLNWSF